MMINGGCKVEVKKVKIAQRRDGDTTRKVVGTTRDPGPEILLWMKTWWRLPWDTSAPYLTLQTRVMHSRSSAS